MGRPTKAMSSVGSQEADDIVDLLGFCWCKGHDITTQLQVEDFPMHQYPSEAAATPHFLQWFKVSGALDSGYRHANVHVLHRAPMCAFLNCANLLYIRVTHV